MGNYPTHPLAKIRELIEQENFEITATAREYAAQVYPPLGQDEILDCINTELSETQFYKTMQSTRFPNRMQDVYRCFYLGKQLYIKLQIVRGKAIVVQFKEK